MEILFLSIREPHEWNMTLPDPFPKRPFGQAQVDSSIFQAEKLRPHWTSNPLCFPLAVFVLWFQ